MKEQNFVSVLCLSFSVTFVEGIVKTFYCYST